MLQTPHQLRLSSFRRRAKSDKDDVQKIRRSLEVEIQLCCFQFPPTLYPFRNRFESSSNANKSILEALPRLSDYENSLRRISHRTQLLLVALGR